MILKNFIDSNIEFLLIIKNNIFYQLLFVLNTMTITIFYYLND